MRRRAAVDRNQSEIVNALRRIGCTVHCTHQQGDGFPDIVVGFRGVNYLLEIKDGTKPASAQALTKDEADWHEAWQGRVVVVNSITAALEAVGAYDYRKLSESEKVGRFPGKPKK